MVTNSAYSCKSYLGPNTPRLGIAKCTWPSFLFVCSFLLHWRQCLMISVHTSPKCGRMHQSNKTIFWKVTMFSASKRSYFPTLRLVLLKTDLTVYQVLTKHNVPHVSSVSSFFVYSLELVLRTCSIVLVFVQPNLVKQLETWVCPHQQISVDKKLPKQPSVKTNFCNNNSLVNGYRIL